MSERFGSRLLYWMIVAFIALVLSVLMGSIWAGIVTILLSALVDIQEERRYRRYIRHMVIRRLTDE